MQDSLLLALDLGTSSTRTALFDSAGNRLPHTLAQLSYTLVTSNDGAAELEPSALLNAVEHCLGLTMAQYRSDNHLHGRRIAGIGVSCFWHSLIGVDLHGKPLTRAITWADARCRDDAAKLREKFSEKAIHARTGCMLRTSFWPAKLRWLRRTQPKLFSRVSYWLSPAEWLQILLTGAAYCAPGMATGTGLYDPSKLNWDSEMLEHCEVTPAQMRPLSEEPIPVDGRLASLYPELRGALWYSGIGDGAASNLGSGATKPGFAAINVGTSAALRVMQTGKKARAPFGLFCYRVDSERFLVGGAVSNAGNLRAWALRELRLPPDGEIEEELNRRSGPEHGLTVLPFWTAERAPTWNEDLRGAILGMTFNTTAVDVLQALTEATYYRIAQIAELITGEGEAPKYLVSGGILHSHNSMQRLADILGRPIHANAEPEASIRGAAVYAAEKLGFKVAKLELAKPVKPRPKLATAYAAERARQQRLERILEQERRALDS